MRNTASYRMRRVNEAIKEIIGQVLAQDVKDPRIGFVTLTGVETAPDLSRAKVFLSVYGKQSEKDATFEGLRAARPYLQRVISDELKMKRTPTLEFVYDQSVDQGMRIQAMLKASGVEERCAADEEMVSSGSESSTDEDPSSELGSDPGKEQ